MVCRRKKLRVVDSESANLHFLGARRVDESVVVKVGVDRVRVEGWGRGLRIAGWERT